MKATDYEEHASDPHNWLQRAKGAKVSAELLLAELRAIMPLSQVDETVRIRKLGYMQSAMFLMGTAFENVLKGLAVADKPKSWRRFNHDLVRLAESVTTCSDPEIELLTRLQEFVVWAGKYHIPMNAERYESGWPKLKLLGVDGKNAARLFDRLERELMAKARSKT